MKCKKYTKAQLEGAVKRCYSLSEVVRYFNGLEGFQTIKTNGSSVSGMKRRLIKLEIDFSHFTGRAHNKGRLSPRRLKPLEILKNDQNLDARRGAKQLRRALIEYGIEYKCKVCDNIGEHNGSALTLQVDHIDGDWKNNAVDNVRFLCPNCHSQTVNYGFKGSPKKKVYKPKRIQDKKFEISRDELLKLIESPAPMVQIGKMFGVSDSAIRKRCKSLGIDYKSIRSKKRYNRSVAQLLEAPPSWGGYSRGLNPF